MQKHHVKYTYLIVAAVLLLLPVTLSANNSALRVVSRNAALTNQLRQTTGTTLPTTLGHTASPDEIPDDIADANLEVQPVEMQPFGANLFSGNWIKTRDNGLNPLYEVMTGDKIAVYTWGVVELSNVFTVDGQGNIFLPQIGPIHVAGVAHANLNKTVEAAVRRVYIRNVGVYTELLTANPVAVFVTGGVQNPGRYGGLPSDSILYFLDQADGIHPTLGSYRKVVILRQGKEIAAIDLYDFLLNGKIDVPQLQENDTILVTRRGPVIQLDGNVATPTLIEFAEEKNTGKDALKIIPNAATATEVTITGVRDGRPFAKTVTITAFQNETLRDGDIITIRNDGRADTILIGLTGEFDGPSVLTIKRGSRLIDVLNMIPTSRALGNTDAVHILRKSVAMAQKDSINDSLFRLERSALLALSNSRGEAEIRVREAELTAQFVERARQIQPLGRVVTAHDGQQLNVVLEDGDTIVIPQRTNVIRIGGEVMISQAVIYKEDLTAKEYIQMAGGYSERADDDLVIVLHADASVSMEEPDAHILPGDEILVPPRIDVKVLQNATDVMQIIYQVAMSAGVVLAI
ncbi:MAG: polysaccharide biosynthesis/export family protein [Deltaproteobacteria bacterium]|nr:polysaccharide biosynthesis/export family protein [Deltaproteobacteria bacterium]MBN2674456.1 polysaccharide biosynthesis/export family protein [Deltaproteobacteria bacterium]